MKPIFFPQMNKRLLAPDGMKNCGTLEVYCDGKHCISQWDLDWKERVKVLFGAKVWLWVHSGNTQPPVAMEVDNPWKQKKRTLWEVLTQRRSISTP